MDKIAIILGGGNGTRAGGPLPKQFQEIAGEEVLVRSVKAFLDSDGATDIYIVVHPEFLAEWEDKAEELERTYGKGVYLVCGGRNRRESVSNALLMMSEMGVAADALVAVHDGARPLVTAKVIKEGWNAAARKGAAVPVVPVTDSLRRKKYNGESESVNRADYMAVQTPQVFNYDILHNSYAQAGEGAYTDDASIVEGAGYSISTFAGSTENIKITNPGDFAWAAAILAAREEKKL